MNRLFRLIIIGVVALFVVGCKTQQVLVSSSCDSLKTTHPGQEFGFRASKTLKHDLLHTKLEFSLDWKKQQLNGIATLSLAPYWYEQQLLELDAKGFDIHSVNRIEEGQLIPLTYDYNQLLLRINLDKTFTRDDIYQVKIEYTAKPNELEVIGSDAIAQDKGLYFVNQLGDNPNKPRQVWTQGETEASSCWFPTIDSPNQNTTQEMYITVADTLTTLSNGLLMYSSLNGDGTKTDYWLMDQPHAPYLFMFAVGDFAVVEDSWDDVNLQYIVDREYEKYATDIFGNTPEMLSFFSDRFGYKYPWQKYSQIVVHDFVSGAMENTTATVFMEDLHVTKRELLDDHWDGIIAHELSHHWFGDLVTCESWSQIPLNESFANYCEYLWTEHKYGQQQADYLDLQERKAYLKEAKKKQVDLIRYYYVTREDMFDRHSYDKGGRILHMLRKYVGDEAFFSGLSLYLHRNEYASVEAHQLRLAMEEITGEDLNWFFNQWFFASGHPQLTVRDSYQNGILTIKVWQHQDPCTTPIYKLPLFVDVWLDSIKSSYLITLEDDYEEFEFEIEEQPSLVLFDGEQQLLAEVDHEKTISEYLFQYQNSNKFLARYNALEVLKHHVDKLPNANVFYEALTDEHWAIRQQAVNIYAANDSILTLKVKNKLAIMAVEDSRTYVRSDALTALSEVDVNAFENLYLKSLADSSYSVMGAALVALQELKTSGKTKLDVDEIIESYTMETNINIIIPLGMYYTDQKDYTKAIWFEEKMDALKGGDLYYFLDTYEKFIHDADTLVKNRAFSLLEEYAFDHPKWYVRLKAYLLLSLNDEQDAVLERMRKIRENETYPKLIKIYSEMEEKKAE